jgi:hypothetical protein
MKNNEEHEKAMAEFLAKGGVIQQGSYRESGRVEGETPNNPWARKKAGRPAAADVEVDPNIESAEDEE